MSADYLITAAVIGVAALFLGIWIWRSLRNGPRCNCGNCDAKLDLKKQPK